ncbi:MAG: methionine gamma-lyase family protein [Parasporobacterium sp.]|nr:methionine gamma-lyase family protein [Parasporobacterium sp.]
MFNYPDISEPIFRLAQEAEDALQPAFQRIEQISEANQYKVLQSFIKNKVSESDFFASSGYGYNELGREKLEQVYADIFHTEDALVRPQITCGTHALYLALSAVLLPGDEILFITGKPYDSLEKSIGITDSPGSLKEHQITWKIAELRNGAEFDFDAIRSQITDRTKVVYIQRSKGYAARASLSSESIGEAIRYVRSIRENLITVVDNCYGEFVDLTEPTDHGADLCVGSLIKNPGGGLAPIGGYIAGRKDLIERCAFRLTAPGLGKEVGGSLGVLKSFYQGLSLAPSVTASALKSASFAAALFERLGFCASPSSREVHHCIVETITLKDPELVNRFCQAIQSASYVDSHVTPVGYDMPGYSDPVIMASGAFISGSSIEVSADGPLRDPYYVFFQGGLTYEHGKYALMKAAESVCSNLSEMPL